MRTLPVLLATAVITVVTTALPVVGSTEPASAAPAATSTQDRTFMAANAQTDLAEISTGKLAQTKSGTPSVTTLAGQVVKDHTTALAKLRAVAKQTGVTLPTAPSAAQLAAAKQLQQAPSSDFDRLYLQNQAVGHRASIASTQTELKQGTNSAVKAFADYYLPVAKMHLGMVNQAIEATHVDVNQVAPPGTSAPGTAPVSKGPLAHGAKTKPSNDTGWLIGLLVVVVLVLGVLVIWFLRRSSEGRSAR